MRCTSKAVGYDLLDVFQVTQKDVGVQNHNQLWQDTNRQKSLIYYFFIINQYY